MTNTVKTLPLNANSPLNGVAAQIIGAPSNFDNTHPTAKVTAYVEQVQTPVTVTRNSEAVTQNPINGDLSLVAADTAAFGDVGIQVSPAKINVLTNSDMRDSTNNYTVTDTGGICTLCTTEDSGISESDTAFRVRLVNTTGNPQTVTIHQATSGLINEYWTAQLRHKVLEVVGFPVPLIRVVDVSNASITSSVMEEDTQGLYMLTSTIQQLGAGSADLRWELNITLADTETFDLLFTNAQMAISPWTSQYVTSAVGPTTREADDIDIGGIYYAEVLTPFFSHATDEMWSIDFNTNGTLATITTPQLQYIMSSYDGVNGTNIFVDDPNTITWQADFNGALEPVTIALGVPLGIAHYRLFFRITTNGGNFDRQMFIEDPLNGNITASAILTTANLPIAGTVTKLGRDDADANYFDGFIGRFMFWDQRSNESMNRINTNWPV